MFKAKQEYHQELNEGRVAKYDVFGTSVVNISKNPQLYQTDGMEIFVLWRKLYQYANSERKFRRYVHQILLFPLNPGSD